MMTNKQQQTALDNKAAALTAIKAYIKKNKKYAAKADAIDLYESFLHDTGYTVNSTMIENAIYAEIEYFQVNA